MFESTNFTLNIQNELVEFTVKRNKFDLLWYNLHQIKPQYNILLYKRIFVFYLYSMYLWYKLTNNVRFQPNFFYIVVLYTMYKHTSSKDNAVTIFLYCYMA